MNLIENSIENIRKDINEEYKKILRELENERNILCCRRNKKVIKNTLNILDQFLTESNESFKKGILPENFLENFRYFDNRIGIKVIQCRANEIFHLVAQACLFSDELKSNIEKAYNFSCFTELVTTLITLGIDVQRINIKVTENFCCDYDKEFEIEEIKLIEENEYTREEFSGSFIPKDFAYMVGNNDDYTDEICIRVSEKISETFYDEEISNFECTKNPNLLSVLLNKAYDTTEKKNLFNNLLYSYMDFDRNHKVTKLLRTFKNLIVPLKENDTIEDDYSLIVELIEICTHNNSHSKLKIRKEKVTNEILNFLQLEFTNDEISLI